MSISRQVPLFASGALTTAPWRRLSHAAITAVAWAAECRARATQRRALTQLTDWQLRDIGISRSEANWEARKWFGSR